MNSYLLKKKKISEKLWIERVLYRNAKKMIEILIKFEN